MSAPAAMSGALLAAGVIVGLIGLRRVPPARLPRLPRIAWRRLALPLLAGAVVGLLTGWPVAALLGAIGAGFLPTLLGPPP